ncbi:MAG: hypothetical protein V1836_00830 [Candidatus Aenigmatarchaeota archaeon]
MLKDEQKAVLIALVIGVIAGILSKYASSSLGIVLGLAFAYALNSSYQRLFKDKKAGWSTGNLIIPYIFAWVITWIFIFNV